MAKTGHHRRIIAAATLLSWDFISQSVCQCDFKPSAHN